MLVLLVDWIAWTMERPRVGEVPPAMAMIGIVSGERGRAGERAGYTAERVKRVEEDGTTWQR